MLPRFSLRDPQARLHTLQMYLNRYTPQIDVASVLVGRRYTRVRELPTFRNYFSSCASSRVVVVSPGLFAFV